MNKRTSRTYNKISNICNLEIPQREEKERGAKHYGRVQDKKGGHTS
jgi:hypothetical protein